MANPLTSGHTDMNAWGSRPILAWRGHVVTFARREKPQPRRWVLCVLHPDKSAHWLPLWKAK